jgi:hypothetical protein
MIMELNSRLIKKNNPNKDQMDKELKEAYMCVCVYKYIFESCDLWYISLTNKLKVNILH